MPPPLTLTLSPEQRRELEHVRDHDPLPHLREKAAALLKIAAGDSGRAVARHGLLRPRRTDTVYAWVRRYRADGVAGLRVRGGRGRKPAFSPSAAGRRQRTDRSPARGAPGAGAVRP